MSIEVATGGLWSAVPHTTTNEREYAMDVSKLGKILAYATALWLLAAPLFADAAESHFLPRLGAAMIDCPIEGQFGAALVEYRRMGISNWGSAVIINSYAERAAVNSPRPDSYQQEYARYSAIAWRMYLYVWSISDKYFTGELPLTVTAETLTQRCYVRVAR
jgi:hypothetical protein